MLKMFQVFDSSNETLAKAAEEVNTSYEVANANYTDIKQAKHDADELEKDVTEAESEKTTCNLVMLFVAVVCLFVVVVVVVVVVGFLACLPYVPWGWNHLAFSVFSRVSTDLLQTYIEQRDELLALQQQVQDLGGKAEELINKFAEASQKYDKCDGSIPAWGMARAMFM